MKICVRELELLVLNTTEMVHFRGEGSSHDLPSREVIKDSWYHVSNTVAKNPPKLSLGKLSVETHPAIGWYRDYPAKNSIIHGAIGSIVHDQNSTPCEFLRRGATVHVVIPRAMKHPWTSLPRIAQQTRALYSPADNDTSFIIWECSAGAWAVAATVSHKAKLYTRALMDSPATGGRPGKPMMDTQFRTLKENMASKEQKLKNLFKNSASISATGVLRR